MDRTYYALVDKLYGFLFGMRITAVACFVRAFYVNKYKVVIFQCFYCRLCFAVIVCVYITGCL